MGLNDDIRWFDDDELAARWLDGIGQRVSWDAFKSQYDIVYMSGELGKGRKPMVREGAIDRLHEIVKDALGGLEREIVMNYVHNLYKYGDVDVCDEIAKEYNWHNGLNEDDEDYMVGAGADPHQPREEWWKQ